jgi:hypothetical protein
MAIEATEKILVGLATASVLRDDEAGNRFQHFAGTKNRAILDLLCAHCSLGAGVGDADQVILATLHVDGSADGTHDQRDAQRGRRPCSPHGDKEFFGFKAGIHYNEPIISRSESRKNEKAVRARMCRSSYSTVRAQNMHVCPGNHRARCVNDRS